jgi:hypothetical protein|tara:strand:+ start:49 stop:243 length:195 start_codon:yes stop_codon:yes gene_type:complete
LKENLNVLDVKEEFVLYVQPDGGFNMKEIGSFFNARFVQMLKEEYAQMVIMILEINVFSANKFY